MNVQEQSSEGTILSIKMEKLSLGDAKPMG